MTISIPPSSSSVKMHYRKPCDVSLLDAKGGAVVTFRATDYPEEGGGRTYESWFLIPNDAAAVRVDGDESATFEFLKA